MSDEPSERPRGWTEFGFLAALFLSSRLLVAAVAVIGPLLLKTDARFPGRLTDIGWKAYVNLWDVGWYGNVALEGYRFGGAGESNIAFFPVFPLLLRGLHAIGLDVVTAGLLVSNLSFAGALWLMFRLMWRETGRRETAERAAALLAFSPAAAWFSLGLTESLYLLLTLALVTLARRRWWGAVLVVGVLAGLTRPNGFILAVPAIVLAWPELRQAWRAQRAGAWAWLGLAATGPILGAALFFVYLRMTFGSWTCFQTVNAAQWHNGISVTWETLAQRIPGIGLRLFDAPMIYMEHVAWSWTLVLATGLIAAIALWERRAAAWHAALLATFFAFHAFLYQGITPAGPIARYAAVVPAFYVGLVLFAEERRWAQPVILAASVAALVVQTAMVFGGYHLN